MDILDELLKEIEENHSSGTEYWMPIEAGFFLRSNHSKLGYRSGIDRNISTFVIEILDLWILGSPELVHYGEILEKIELSLRDRTLEGSHDVVDYNYTLF